MRVYRWLPFISKVLPTVYDDALSYYEVLGRVIKYLDDMATTVNDHSKDIAELAEKLREIEGISDAQIRDILEDMLQAGEFDFLIDLYTGSTIFNQIVGIEPYAQVAPEILAYYNHFGDPTGMFPVTMAIGVNGAIPVVQMAFCNREYTRSELVTFNLASGDVIAHAANTAKTHIGDAAYNPKDGYYYYAGAKDLNNNGKTWISVFDVNCQHVKDIECYSDATLGHICFLDDGTAYLIYMPHSAASNQSFRVYSDISQLTSMESDAAAQALIATVNYNLPSNHQRQGMFTDGSYLYVLRGHFGSKYDIKNRYQVIDIWSIGSNKIPAYFQTVTLDSEMEMETGDYYQGNYYINFNSYYSALIAKAAFKAQDISIGNNRAYSYLLHNRRVVKLDNTEAEIYVNGGATNYLVDGTASKPYVRLETAAKLLPNHPQDGIVVHVSGDLTVNGKYKRTMWRCVREQLTIQGDGTAQLPYQVSYHNMDFRMSNVSINGNEDQCLQIYYTQHAELNAVVFNPSDTRNVLAVEASEVIVTDCSISEEGTFANALRVDGARIKGTYNYLGTNTTIGEYELTMGNNVANRGSYFTISDTGIDVYIHIRTSAAIAAEAVLASLPATGTYKVRWFCDRPSLPANPYLAAGDNRIYFDYAKHNFKTAFALDANVSLVVTGHIPITLLMI